MKKRTRVQHEADLVDAKIVGLITHVIGNTSGRCQSDVADKWCSIIAQLTAARDIVLTMMHPDDVTAALSGETETNDSALKPHTAKQEIRLTPTMYLRWFNENAQIGNPDGYTAMPIMVLEQLYEGSDGSERWVRVPSHV